MLYSFYNSVYHLNYYSDKFNKEYFSNLFHEQQIKQYFFNFSEKQWKYCIYQLNERSTDGKLKVRLKNYRIQLENRKSKMMKSIQKQETLMKNFCDFFVNIRESKLTGFHTDIIEKTRQNIDPISFGEAKNILLKINQKSLFKNKKNWKRDQVTLFLYIVDKCCIKYNQDFLDFSNETWESIASMIPGRNGESCKIKILSLVPNNLNQIPWTQIQQQILANVIEEEGISKWKTVSLKLYEKNPIKIYRSSKQCRERYMCFLKPDLKKGFWTDEEDYELIKLFLKYGRKWSKMAQHIKGRNENAIKNRFFLLFQQSSNNQKLYYSQFIRKVMRRKERLQKILQIEQISEQENVKGEIKKIENCHKETIENVKSEVSSTEREYKPQQLAEIQKFFSF